MSYLENLFTLKGKTALVTGAAGGIGSAIAGAFHSAGALVLLCDINTEELGRVVNNLNGGGGENPGENAGVNIGGNSGENTGVSAAARAHSFTLDMTDISAFKTLVADAAKISGRIDILVNCAGINKREGLVDVEEATYDRIMDINLKGAFFLSQAVAPYMKNQKSGSIINIGSHNTGAVLGGVSVYGASKSGILSLTRSMAIEWAKYNIRANCISPGHIKTSLTVPTWEHPERSKFLLDRIALGRPGLPEDITGLCILLASDASSYITGAEFRIDGGCMAGGQPWPYDTKF